MRRIEIAVLNLLLKFSRATAYYRWGTLRFWVWYHLIELPITGMVSAWRVRELRAGRLTIAPTTGFFDVRR